MAQDALQAFFVVSFFFPALPLVLSLHSFFCFLAFIFASFLHVSFFFPLPRFHFLLSLQLFFAAFVVVVGGAVGEFVGGAVGAVVGESVVVVVVAAVVVVVVVAASEVHAAPSPRSQQFVVPHGATRLVPLLT